MKVRRILASFGAGALMSGALAALSAQAADAVAINTFAPIFNHGAGKCLTVQPNANGYGDNGLRIVLATCNGSDLQAWSFRDAGRCPGDCDFHEMYEIQNKYTFKCIDLNNGSGANQTPIQQWDCVDNANMKWHFQPYDTRGGIFKLVNERGGTCMDVQWGSHEDGAPLWGYHCFDDLNNGAQTYFHS
jgi:hypothetical protein